MRRLCLLLFLTACDPYGSVQREDTIEAYEAYLRDHASGPNVFRAEVRLEELYLDKARKDKTLEAWDALLARFPKGHHHETALAEREESLFAWAEEEMTAEAWERFLTEYPKPKQKRAKAARDALAATTYCKDVTIGPVAMEAINLARDPEGAKDGWSMTAEVTNGGDKTIETLWMRVHYLDAAGNSLGAREWPVVAPYSGYPVPVREDKTVPMAPGDTRVWEWTTGDLPTGWANKARLVPFRIAFVGEE